MLVIAEDWCRRRNVDGSQRRAAQRIAGEPDQRERHCTSRGSLPRHIPQSPQVSLWLKFGLHEQATTWKTILICFFIVKNS